MKMKENEKDLDEIPDDIKNDITFITVEDYDEIFKTIFKSGDNNG